MIGFPKGLPVYDLHQPTLEILMAYEGLNQFPKVSKDTERINLLSPPTASGLASDLIARDERTDTHLL